MSQGNNPAGPANNPFGGPQQDYQDYLVKSDVSFNTLLGRDSGETFQIAFEGPGWVLIQPSEGPTVPPHTHARQGGFR